MNNKIQRHYYVQYDTFVSPKNPGHGFANTKALVAFGSYQDMLDYLRDRRYWDFSVRRVSRRYAERYAERIPEDRYRINGRGIYIANSDDDSDVYYNGENYVVTYESKY